MELGRQFKDFATPDQVYAHLEGVDKQFGTSFTDPRSVGVQKSFIEKLGGPAREKTAYMEVPTFEGSLRDVEGMVLHRELGAKNINLMSEPVSKVPHSAFLLTRTGGTSRSVDFPEFMFIDTPEHSFDPFKSDKRVANSAKDLRKKLSILQNDVRDEILKTENFGKSLSETHLHLRSPQLQNEIARVQRHSPNVKSGRFIEHLGYGSRTTHQDFIDLQTGTWAKLDPEGYFPDEGVRIAVNRDWL